MYGQDNFLKNHNITHSIPIGKGVGYKMRPYRSIARLVLAGIYMYF